MIVVMGIIKGQAGEVDRLMPDMKAQMAATQAEDGCELYVFTRDFDDPDTVYISERWRDEAALAAHAASAHMATFNRAVGGAKLNHVSVKAYSVSGVRTIIGPD